MTPFLQRCFDIIFSALGLLFLFPVFLICFAVLPITGEGEILYRQPRVGHKGAKFNLLKFATMLKDSPSMINGTITINGDPRILPFGKFLRKSKINELPQLINVLRGDMSLIGPRPLTEETFCQYSGEVQKKILTIKPGLSGVGSIIFRNEETIVSQEENISDFYYQVILPYKGELECWYVENRSVKNYFLMLALTIVVVINSESNIIKKVFSDLPVPPERLRH